MQFLPNIPFPNNEKQKLALLENLFRDWHQHFANNGSLLEKHIADAMVFDGFYPNYFSQKKKVLFIGWESVDISHCNNTETLHQVYREGKYIGPRHLDQDKFHSRLLRVAYGVINRMPAWKDIPNASTIGDTLGDANGLSFAFMNISKLSNDSGESAADWPVIKAAYGLSIQSRNFIQEEVAILEPDIIITMNLIDKLEDGLASLGKWIPIHYSPGLANSYWLDVGSHRSLLIDTWHFSAPTKDAKWSYMFRFVIQFNGAKQPQRLMPQFRKVDDGCSWSS